MAGILRFEELEERIAPTVVAAGEQLSFTDSDGDGITVAYNGPDGSSVDVQDVDGNDIENGEDIGGIYFTNSDLSSVLLVYGSSSDDTIVIKDKIATTDAGDVGAIVIGFGDGGTAGVASFDDYFGVDIAGTLGVFAANGSIDCDVKGQWIRAGGDIGWIAVDELTLSSTFGQAVLAAGGSSGGGDISFITCETVYVSTGGAECDWQDIPVGGVRISDDVGTGSSGFITLALSGSAPEGSYLAIPVYGGGSVLAGVYVDSANAALTCTTAGAGGDIGTVEFGLAASGVTVSGVADSDLLYVSGSDRIGQVVNKTTGGDIGAVSSGGDIGLIQTGKLGVLGAIYGGARNAVPLVSGLYEAGYTTFADGAIGSVKVGAITGTAIQAETIGTIATTAGGIMESDIRGIYGIGSISSKDAIVRTDICAIAEENSTDGGSIGSFTAPTLVETDVVALGDITKFTVTRGMYNSTVSTYIDDGVGGHVGGGITSLTVGGMGDGSLVETNHGIASAKVGAGGVLQSTIWAHEGLTSIQVAGDVVDGTIRSDGSFGSVKIGGDVIHESYLHADSATSIAIMGNLSEGTVEMGAGATGPITIGGNLAGSSGGISVEGDVASIAVKGYVFADGNEKMHVDGEAGTVSVAGTVHHAQLNFNHADVVKVGGSMMGSTIYGQTLLGSVSVGRSMNESYIFSDGNVGAITVKGIFTDGVIGVVGSVASVTVSDIWDGTVACDGNMGLVTVKAGDISGNVTVEVGGDFAGMKVKGVIAGDVSVGGNLTGSILSAGSDAVEYGGAYYFASANGQIIGGALTVEGTVLPGVVIS